MSKIAVVYWSGTGNTEAMAKEVGAGVENKGNEASLFTAADFNEGLVADFDGLAFGCPAMGSENLEEDEFEPMFKACLPKLSGKKVVLFGSYDWGDGEWMRDWEEACKENGAELLASGLMVNLEPDEAALAQCKKLGELF